LTSSNPLYRKAVVTLERAGRDQNAPIWTTAAMLLGRARGTRVEVNLGHVSRMAGKGKAFFVPGKVLGTGVIEKGVVVGAFSFSDSARQKLEAAGGSALSVEEFLAKYPKGGGVILVQ